MYFDGFLCLTWGGYPDTHRTMPRAMRVEYLGAIYPARADQQCAQLEFQSTD
jgi:hypothetical protein